MEVNHTIIDVRGEITKGDIDLNVTYVDSSEPVSEDGWNLVGNPYPAPIDWELIQPNVSTNNVSPTFSVWDMGNQLYTYYSIGNISVNGGIRNIAMSQGFWVQTTGTSPSLIIKESMKTLGSAFFLRTAQLDNLLKIALSDGISTDEAVIHFRDDASQATDHFDAFKMKNDIFNFSSISEENQHLAINAHPVLDTYLEIKLSLQDIEPGSYQMNFSGIETINELNALSLVDNFLDQNIDLLSANQYDFTITDDPLTWGDERFILKFGMANAVTGMVESLMGKVSIYPNPAGDQLTIDLVSPTANEKAIITIHNLTGKIVDEKSFLTKDYSHIETVDVKDLKQGMYFITIFLDGTIYKGKFLKN